MLKIKDNVDLKEQGLSLEEINKVFALVGENILRGDKE